MRLSRSCEYALLAVWHLAKRKDSSYVSIREIADENGLSFFFLTKVLHTLTQRGILASLKGPKGGIALARPAEEIKIIDIVEVIDGLGFLEQCITGLPKCDEKNPCPLHNDWKRIREELYTMMAGKSVAQLVDFPREPFTSSPRPRRPRESKRVLR